MPLPLPNLDARRWRDLVEEGRALIPRHSRRWTDHNLHDPGITFMELFAAWVERGQYSANRIPRRHVLKFLALAGFSPRPARPARVPIAFGGTAPATLPDNLMLDATTDTRITAWRLTADLTVVDNAIDSLQSFDGREFIDLGRFARDGAPFPPFGSDPGSSRVIEECPAFYVGFEKPLRHGETLTLFVEVAGEHEADREELREEWMRQRQRCAPSFGPCLPHSQNSEGCADADSDPRTSSSDAPSAPWLLHHDVRVVWEIWSAGSWRLLTPDECQDDTRALTLSGTIALRPGQDSSQERFGRVVDAHHYLRCRREAGQWDSAPRLSRIMINAVLAVQEEPLVETLSIVPGAAVSDVSTGLERRFRPKLDDHGVVTEILEVADDVDAPRVFVFDYDKPGANPGRIGFSLRALRDESGVHGSILRGDGLPEQIGYCTNPLSGNEPVAWVLGDRWERWALRADLDAANGTTAAIATENQFDELRFGDGRRGRVLPPDNTAWVSGAATLGRSGSIASSATWDVRKSSWNRTLTSPADPGAGVVARNPSPSIGGRDPETLEDALRRALDSMWVHERLLEVGDANGGSLDRLDEDELRALPRPGRAATSLDYERLAFAVPGVSIRRARAWPDFDARYPGRQSPGAVTVIVVPSLPRRRPMPSPGLLRRMRGFLDSYRTVCTRVVVVGPEYVEIVVRARIRLHDGRDESLTLLGVRGALEAFLDPLGGGPGGRGWPFGRDVYRSEVLQVIDQVAGVDHVVSLELVANGRPLQCANACIPDIALVTSGPHILEIEP